MCNRARILPAVAAAFLLAIPGRIWAANPGTAADLYKTTHVWTLHLRFTPDQWEAMEPKGGFGPFGMPGRPGGPGPGPGPEGPRGPGGPGGPGAPGLAFLVAPAVMEKGDSDKDGRLSQEEFSKLGSGWFRAWDTNHAGILTSNEIRAGLSSDFTPPGGPRGGMGLMLQGAEGKRNGLASAMGVEFVYVHADLEFEGQLLKNVGVRYKGNGTFMESRGSLKRSLKIDFNKYVKGQKLGDVDGLTLQNNVTDGSWMNEVLSYRLYRDAGVPAPRTAYAKVYVTVPDKFDRQYFGLYSLSEDVDRDFEEDRFGTRQGAILKPVTPSLFSDLGSEWSRYNQTYDPKVTLREEQKKRIIELCHFVTRSDDAEFAARIGRYIDLPEFARYLAVTVLVSDLDGILGPGQNMYLHLDPRTQLIQFIPWDQDHSFGIFGASQEERENLSIHRPWKGENRFMERMFKVEAFKKEYLAKLDAFTRTIFQPARLAQLVDELAPVIRPAVEEESEEKLTNFDKHIAGELVSGRGFGPFGESIIKPIKPFTTVRAKAVSDQLAGRSEGMVVENFGFGQVPRPGGPGGRGGRGGPALFGPGMLFADPLLKALDEDKDSRVTEKEFTNGFAKFFDDWNSDKSGFLSQDQLRTGIDKDLSPFRDGFPGFGPPPGGPRP